MIDVAQAVKFLVSEMMAALAATKLEARNRLGTTAQRADFARTFDRGRQ